MYIHTYMCLFCYMCMHVRTYIYVCTYLHIMTSTSSWILPPPPPHTHTQTYQSQLLTYQRRVEPDRVSSLSKDFVDVRTEDLTTPTVSTDNFEGDNYQNGIRVVTGELLLLMLLLLLLVATDVASVVTCCY